MQKKYKDIMVGEKFTIIGGEYNRYFKKLTNNECLWYELGIKIQLLDDCDCTIVDSQSDTDKESLGLTITQVSINILHQLRDEYELDANDALSVLNHAQGILNNFLYQEYKKNQL